MPVSRSLWVALTLAVALMLLMPMVSASMSFEWDGEDALMETESSTESDAQAELLHEQSAESEKPVGGRLAALKRAAGGAQQPDAVDDGKRMYSHLRDSNQQPSGRRMYRHQREGTLAYRHQKEGTLAYTHARGKSAAQFGKGGGRGGARGGAGGMAAKNRGKGKHNGAGGARGAKGRSGRHGGKGGKGGAGRHGAGGAEHNPYDDAPRGRDTYIPRPDIHIHVKSVAHSKPAPNSLLGLESSFDQNHDKLMASLNRLTTRIQDVDE